MKNASEWKARPATSHTDRHTIHSYFTSSPESLDGTRVLFYSSATREGHNGDLRILHRADGRETIIADNIVTEDAHRVACQQWIGEHVVYQTLEDGHWKIRVYNCATRRTSTPAQNVQLGWGQARGKLVPLHGLHWDATTNRDLQLLDVENGHIATVLTASQVRAEYSGWVRQTFGDRPISIFFPILSPDLKRVVFKVAAPSGGNWQSNNASTREGLIVYDLKEERFLFFSEKWGHPAWMPDSRHLLNVPGVLIDSDDGAVQKIPHWPQMSGSHPSPSSDGKYFVSDCGLQPYAEKISAIVVGALPDGESEIIHRFFNGEGASSWRPPHPHPAFNPDGKRIYFHDGSTPWTRLLVLERQ
jgi:hypothetical protein